MPVLLIALRRFMRDASAMEEGVCAHTTTFPSCCSCSVPSS
jgi:hypothetical protein